MSLSTIKGLQRRWHFILWCAFALILSLSIWIHLPTTWPLGYDSWSYLAAARALHHGDVLTTPLLWRYLPEAIRPWQGGLLGVGPYLYPPLLALLLQPLVGLAFPQALTIWLLIVLASTLALVPLLHRTLGWRLALLAVLGFPPVWQSLWMGQINSVIAVCSLLAFHALQKDSSYRVGAWLALGTLLKLTPALALLVLLVQRRWRSVAAALAMIGAIVLLSLIWLPSNSWVAGVQAALMQRWDAPGLLSWTAFTYRLGGDAGVLLSMATMGVFLLLTLMRARTMPPLLAFAAATCLPLLIARITWEHHALMILPALAMIWSWSYKGRVLASATWLSIALLGGVAMPVSLTLCWAACCWPHLLHDANADGCAVA